ncbi:tyrosine-tRNA ligase [Ceraceosorus guamensis]|uniref:Tyrosine--tRNA ligase n=1 Tax=Ceraceosorus guamensis TaxID=1522189 RepID=A0A316W1M2_9BASI|nr:tyrosine-tRNA ligase [Ceraceosorus guamensis]PWN43414.1 tyrosine-tRNA ligase [Ceraceosorus guamensis]
MVHPSVPSGSILNTLDDRGLLKDVTSSNVWQHLGDPEGNPRTIYCGVDPTAASLHIGNLLPLLALWHARKVGHRVIVVIGGATGMIGDPSGRSSERNSLEASLVESNVQRITAQVQSTFQTMDDWAEKLGLGRSRGELVIRNNREWYEGVGILDFLRDVGKYARISKMMARDSVRNRLTPEADADDAVGLSFTEFSYQLLQAYDFHVLQQREGCTVQIGGSDQYGNIMAGVELILRMRSQSLEPAAQVDAASSDMRVPTVAPAYGITVPLLTTADGSKFGKSAGNAIWLDRQLTKDLDLHTHFMKSADEDVAKYLHTLTLLPTSEIQSLVQRHKGMPQRGEAQQTLATQMLGQLRGEDSIKRTKRQARVLYKTSVEEIDVEEALELFQDDPRLIRTTVGEFTSMSVARMAHEYGLAKSGSEARKKMSKGALWINGEKLDDPRLSLKLKHLAPQRDGKTYLALVSVGKQKKVIVVATKGDASAQEVPVLE